MYTVYLIHLKQKLGRPQCDRTAGTYHAHAGHYIGVTKDLKNRLKEHRTNQGAALLRAANRQGITWDLARTWKVSTWSEATALEKKLKARKGAANLCPTCNPQSWQVNARIN